MTENIYKLKALLKKNNISQNLLHEETGYSLVHLSRALNGKVIPSKQFKKLLEHTLRKYATVGKDEISTLLEEIWSG